MANQNAHRGRMATRRHRLSSRRQRPTSGSIKHEATPCTGNCGTEPAICDRVSRFGPDRTLASRVERGSFKSGWGYFTNCQQMLKSWLNGRKESDSICCQPWPRIFRFCHRYGNLLSTAQNRTDVTTTKNTADLPSTVFWFAGTETLWLTTSLGRSVPSRAPHA